MAENLDAGPDEIRWHLCRVKPAQLVALRTGCQRACDRLRKHARIVELPPFRIRRVANNPPARFAKDAEEANDTGLQASFFEGFAVRGLGSGLPGFEPPAEQRPAIAIGAAVEKDVAIGVYDNGAHAELRLEVRELGEGPWGQVGQHGVRVELMLAEKSISGGIICRCAEVKEGAIAVEGSADAACGGKGREDIAFERSWSDGEVAKERAAEEIESCVDPAGRIVDLLLEKFVDAVVV